MCNVNTSFFSKSCLVSILLHSSAKHPFQAKDTLFLIISSPGGWTNELLCILHFDCCHKHTKGAVGHRREEKVGILKCTL